MLLAALSTGHKTGLLAVALIVIAFSLVSSLVAPRRNPDFPGRGLSVFVVVSFVLFALMIGAVELFGVESEAHAKGESVHAAPKTAAIQVVETEWRIQLPSNTAGVVPAATYTFHVVNHGKQPHNLTVAGPAVQNAQTKTLAPGGSADLTVPLRTGTYDLYCSIPGHKQLGMDAKLAIG